MLIVAQIATIDYEGTHENSSKNVATGSSISVNVMMCWFGARANSVQASSPIHFLHGTPLEIHARATLVAALDNW